jgi:hypothetical protein
MDKSKTNEYLGVVTLPNMKYWDELRKEAVVQIFWGKPQMPRSELHREVHKSLPSKAIGNGLGYMRHTTMYLVQG